MAPKKKVAPKTAVKKTEMTEAEKKALRQFANKIVAKAEDEFPNDKKAQFKWASKKLAVKGENRQQSIELTKMAANKIGTNYKKPPTAESELNSRLLDQMIKRQNKISGPGRNQEKFASIANAIIEGTTGNKKKDANLINRAAKKLGIEAERLGYKFGGPTPVRKNPPGTSGFNQGKKPKK